MNRTDRPQYHFSVPQGWANDPNGTVYYDGEYHLFYQHHPDSTCWGPMHWGHAVSRDLLRWEHLPIALYPDELGMIFSGSCVVDAANSSGFGSRDNPPMVAAYTSHGDEGERQSIAWSVDHGRTWTKYGGNPVVTAEGLCDFRDPRLLYHGPTGRWIMVVASGDHARLYDSVNLRDWSLASEFGPFDALGDAVWECPDLFEIPRDGGGDWVFSFSLTAGAGGRNRVACFAGAFDGYRFTTEQQLPVVVEASRDFYAPITFSGSTDRVLWIGWMNCWEYADQIPAGQWRGMMTLPRELSLRNGRLLQYPTAEFLALRRAVCWEQTDFALSFDEPVEIPDPGACFEIVGTLTPGEGELHLMYAGCLELRLNGITGEVGASRRIGTHRCAHPAFTGEWFEDRLDPMNGVDFRIVVDGPAVEVYFGQGEAVFTVLAYPNDPCGDLRVWTENGVCRLNRLAIHRIGDRE